MKLLNRVGDAALALRRNRVQAGLDSTASGILEQGRVAQAAHDILVFLAGLSGIENFTFHRPAVNPQAEV